MLKNQFDPRKSFFELKVVRLTFASIILLSISFFVIIILNSELDSDFSYRGFNYFVDVFKVPLATLALLIPAVALLAANHRSEQTREQILTAQSQNNFSNYYKHVEEFEKFCKNNETEKIKVINVRSLHDIIFEDAKNGDYECSIYFEDSVDEHVGDFFQICRGFEYEMQNADDLGKMLYALDGLKEEWMRFYSVKLIDRHDGVDYKYKGKSIYLSGKRIEGFIQEFVEIANYLVIISNFSGRKITTKNLSKIKNIRITNFPRDKGEAGRLLPFSIEDYFVK